MKNNKTILILAIMILATTAIVSASSQFNVQNNYQIGDYSTTNIQVVDMQNSSSFAIYYYNNTHTHIDIRTFNNSLVHKHVYPVQLKQIIYGTDSNFYAFRDDSTTSFTNGSIMKINPTTGDILQEINFPNKPDFDPEYVHSFRLGGIANRIDGQSGIIAITGRDSTSKRLSVYFYNPELSLSYVVNQTITIVGGSTDTNFGRPYTNGETYLVPISVDGGTIQNGLIILNQTGSAQCSFAIANRNGLPYLSQTLQINSTHYSGQMYRSVTFPVFKPHYFTVNNTCGGMTIDNPEFVANQPIFSAPTTINGYVTIIGKSATDTSYQYMSCTDTTCNNETLTQFLGINSMTANTNIGTITPEPNKLAVAYVADGNIPSFSLLCQASYSCSSFATCNPNNVSTCTTVTDANNCFAPYNPSNYTDFDQACSYDAPTLSFTTTSNNISNGTQINLTTQAQNLINLTITDGTNLLYYSASAFNPVLSLTPTGTTTYTATGRSAYETLQNNLTVTVNCVINYECSQFAQCGTNNIRKCQTVTDTNACGTPYSGAISAYDESCQFNYAPDLTAEDVAPVATDGLTKFLVGFGQVALLLGIIAGIGIMIYLAKSAGRGFKKK